MINGEKIGVGVITCGRPDNFKKLFQSLQPCMPQIDHLCVVEDSIKDNPDFSNYIDSETKGGWKNDGTLKKVITDVNMGVARSKNHALASLQTEECGHIFLIEDDIFIRDLSVFEKYIEASKISGIQHFNFSQHGRMNKTFDGWATPNPNMTVGYYGEVNIPLYPHCVGAFSYYSKKALDAVGLMDENFFNACEHVDHTLAIIKAGMHPPFWNFADIENSWEYLGDEEWSLKQSTITSKSNHREIVQNADKVFLAKHGCLPLQIPYAHKNMVGKTLREIKETYGNRNSES